MPIYEYVCGACGAEVEVMHKISDLPARDCPQCGQPALSKQVSAAGFRLSGGGWYETDFKSKGQKNLSGGAKEPEASAPAPAAAPSSSASAPAD